MNRITWGTNRRRIGAVGAFLALLLSAVNLSVAHPAAAASVLAQIDPSGFTMRAGDFTDRGAAIQRIEASGSVSVRTSPDQVLADGGHAGRAALCHNTNLDGSLKYDGFCWDQADDTSAVWTPQGLTGSHDAQSSGTWNGHYLYIASWHYTDNAYARITIAESTGTSVTYQHVLLVDPYSTGGGYTFRPVGGAGDRAGTDVLSGHADGVTWYGNKLFVATGHQIQVYDLRHLWKMSDTSTDQVGILGNGKSSARYHNWALPMVGVYFTGNTGDPCDATRPCLTSLSLDRTSSPDALVTSQIATKGGGPLIRWPLNASTALPDTDTANDYTGTVTATGAYTVPIWKVQGAATDGTYYYFSGECPETAGTTDSDVPYCIHRALPGAAPHVLTHAPPLTQNLSYAPSSGRLWGLNERENTTTGKRVVFSLVPSA
ncbi:hypothetical protein [Streptomyces sp. NRRL WC-3744]|uniref:hypothetical protein n=1 Tax=Streptomyces sp. NRRL WC-3744 TaxID=1463935 RepID=UPI0006647BE5|nr:hypothetical protein [Streptomyces sp. NRRL WC-3744]